MVVLVLGTPEMNNFFIPCLAQNVYTVLFVFRFALEGLVQLHCVCVSSSLILQIIFYLGIHQHQQTNNSNTQTYAIIWKASITATAPRETNDRPIAKGWQEHYARCLF